MKRIAWIAALSTVALACGGGGGGGGGAPAPSFTYGAPQPVTGSSASAASAASGGIDAVLAYQTSPSSDSAYALVALPDSILSSLNVDVGMALAPAAAAEAAALVRGHISRALGDPSTMDTCAVVSGTKVTFNCSDVLTSTGETVTVTGTVTGTDTGVIWDLSVSISMTESGVSETFSLHYFGNVSVGSTTFSATEQVDLDLNASGNGQSAHLAASELVDLDLNYVTVPDFAITDGTLEVKFWWRALPSDYASSMPQNQGYFFTWTTANGVTTITMAKSQ